MRKLLFVLAVMFAGTIQAQEVIDLTKQLKCSGAQNVMNYFADKHKEVPVWVGKTVHNTHIALLANKETRSWTMVEYDSKLACVLGAGDEKTSSNLEFL